MTSKVVSHAKAKMNILFLLTLLPLVQMAQSENEETTTESTLQTTTETKDLVEHRRFRRHFDVGFDPGFGKFGHRHHFHHRNRRHPPGGPGFGPDFGPGFGPDFGPGFGPGFGGRRRHGPHGHRGGPHGPPGHHGPRGPPGRHGPHGHHGPPHEHHNRPPGFDGPPGPPRGPPGPPLDYQDGGQNIRHPESFKFEDAQATQKPVLKLQTSCGVSTTSRIVGGEEVHRDDWSWTVALIKPLSNGYAHFCGATIITNQHLITASHCVKDLQASDLRVRIGHVNLNDGDPSQDFRAQKITKHPQFNASNYYADIAIIKLQTPIEFSTQIQPCCLPDNTDAAGQDGIVVGWGSTSFGGRTTQVLQQVSLPIWSNEECQSKLSVPVQDVMVCAGRKNEAGHDACQGDSGGPLLARNKAERWALQGIVSFGFKCAQKGVPGVYTRVSKFKDWIVENAI